MPKTAAIDLKERIIASLTDTNSRLWFPHLTDGLVETEWQELEKVGITASNYGTERIVLKDVNAQLDIIVSLPIYNSSETPKANIQIEKLSDNTVQQYESSGVNFYSKEEIIYSEILNCLSDAFQIIGKVPSLFTTVLSLVKSFHIIKPESDEYDVSFSEPNIPFSIFVSAPQTNSEINALRVAEAIVHEAMHLQLTLIEAIVSLISNSEEKFYSPWRDEHRTIGGVLHALYVFHILHSFFINLLDFNLWSSVEKDHVKERRITIAQQIIQINDFANCNTLTSLGKNFTQNLLNVSP